MIPEVLKGDAEMARDIVNEIGTVKVQAVMAYGWEPKNDRPVAILDVNDLTEGLNIQVLLELIDLVRLNQICRRTIKEYQIMSKRST